MKLKYWLIINSVFLVALLGIGVYSLQDKEQSVYLNTAEVFDAFSLQKELRTKMENAQSARKSIVDSLEIRLTAMTNTTNFDFQNPSKDFFSLREAYQQRKKQFEEDNQKQSQEYDRQIWNQLNQYIKDFGKENSYSMIFGANGQGNLMYAEDAKDISKELIEYINRKYART